MGLYDPHDDLPPEKPAPVQQNPVAPSPYLTPSLFDLGQLVATPGAIETMVRKGINPAQLLVRHVTGDWGDLDAEDKRANDLALQQGTRIFSAYGAEHDPDRLWVITEWDRSATTILLPSEY